MTITSVVAVTGQLPGDGSNFSFSFSGFKIYANDELRVYHTVTSTGVQTLLVEGTGSTQYSVSAITFPGTGTITYPATSTGPIPSTETITIKRVLTQDQQTLLKTQGAYFPKTLETQYDKTVAMIQDLQEQVDRCLKVQVTEPTVVNLDVSGGGTFTAGHVVKVDSAGTGFDTAANSAGSDGSASDVTPIDVSVSSGTSGSAADFSREDHRHFLPTTVPRLATETIWAESQIWAKGADVTAAGALDLDASAGNLFDVTGNTAITSIGTVGIGFVAFIQFDGTPVLTHHATNLILPGGVNILMQAGDIIGIYEYASADWRLLFHTHGTATNGRMPGPDFESAETALNNDAQTSFAHGLSRVPSKVEVILRANTATAQGWADNEEMVFSFPYRGLNTTDDGVDLTFDGTSVFITQGTAMHLVDHGAGFSLEAITQSEYDWVVRAWA